jgi:hypothetical protein
MSAALAVPAARRGTFSTPRCRALPHYVVNDAAQSNPFRLIPFKRASKFLLNFRFVTLQLIEDRSILGGGILAAIYHQLHRRCMLR